MTHAQAPHHPNVRLCRKPRRLPQSYTIVEAIPQHLSTKFFCGAIMAARVTRLNAPLQGRDEKRGGRGGRLPLDYGDANWQQTEVPVEWCECMKDS
jgi:hypothetical protein